MRAEQRFDVDPDLEKISPHLPDEEINLLFPFRKFDTQGRRRKFKTNQLYRLHILAMIKGIPSFNKLCQELRVRRSFRDFCFFKNKKSTPPKRMLSEFRNHLKFRDGKDSWLLGRCLSNPSSFCRDENECKS